MYAKYISTVILTKSTLPITSRRTGHLQCRLQRTTQSCMTRDLTNWAGTESIAVVLQAFWTWY